MISVDEATEYKIPVRTVSSKGHIYFLYFKGVLVYIGQTIDIHNRILFHTTDKLFDKAMVVEVDAARLKEIEKWAIREYKPFWSREYGNRPPKFMLCGDFMLHHKTRLASYGVKDGRVYSGENEVGRIKDGILCMVNRKARKILKYDFASDVEEITEVPENKWRDTIGWAFDEAAFTYYPVYSTVRPSTPKSNFPPAENMKSCFGKVFKLPKHRGKTYEWVVKNDVGYIEALREFEIPKSKWFEKQ